MPLAVSRSPSPLWGSTLRRPGPSATRTGGVDAPNAGPPAPCGPGCSCCGAEGAARGGRPGAAAPRRRSCCNAPFSVPQSRAPGVRVGEEVPSLSTTVNSHFPDRGSGNPARLCKLRRDAGGKTLQLKRWEPPRSAPRGAPGSLAAVGPTAAAPPGPGFISAGHASRVTCMTSPPNPRLEWAGVHVRCPAAPRPCSYANHSSPLFSTPGGAAAARSNDQCQWS